MNADTPAFQVNKNWFEVDTYRNTDAEVPKQLVHNWWGAPATLVQPPFCWVAGTAYVPAVKTASDGSCASGQRVTSYLNPSFTTVWPPEQPPVAWPPAVVEPPSVSSDPSAMLGSRKGDGKAEDPVDSMSGNLVHEEVLLASPPGVFGLDAGTTFNSRGVGDGSMGPGWQGSFSQRVALDSSGTASVTLTDGRVVRYLDLGTGGFKRPDVGASLVANVGGTWTMQWFASGVTWSFDAAGLLTGMTSPDGQSIAISRNGSGWPTSVTASPTGASLTYTYGGPGGLLSAVSASDGRAVSIGYSGGFVSSITRPGSRTTTFGTDGAGRVTQITDPSGVVTMACTYDGLGRAVSQTRGVAGTTATFAYDSTALAMTITDGATGHAVVYAHDGSGRVAKMTDPSGKSPQYFYDTFGNLTRVEDRRGKTWTQTFDGHDNVLSSTDPTNVTVSATYDSLDRPLTVTDPAVGIVTYTYAGTNRVPSTVTDAQGSTNTFTITSGLVTQATDPDGVVTSYGYDALRRLTTVTTAAGTTTVGYDAHGNPTSSQSPLGLVTAATYDAADRLATVTDPAAATTTYAWNAADEVTSITDPTGAVWAKGYDTSGRWSSATNPLGDVTNFGFDADGRVTSETSPGGVASRAITWGPLGRVASVKDELNRQTSMAYDDDGNLTTVTDPLSGSSVQTFDNAGRVKTQKDPGNRTTTYNYDAAGRLSQTIDPAGRTIASSYDSVGRTAATTNTRGGVTTYTYTPGGRVATASAPSGGVTTYAYDSAGRLSSVTDPLGHTTTFGYDADGRQTSETSPTGLVTTIGYDNAGRVTSVTDPAGVVSTTGYTSRGQVASQAVGGVTQATYTYDVAGKLTATTDGNGNTTTFGYDGRGRNTAQVAPGGPSSSTGFDAASQVTSRTDALGRTTTYTYDANGRLETFTDPSGKSATISYNASGDPTSYAYGGGPTVTYSYMADGKLSSFSDPGGSTYFAYDAAGDRTRIDAVGNRATDYVFDTSGRRTFLRTPDGSTMSYAYDTADRLVSMTPGETMADYFSGPAGAAPDANRWTTTTANGGTASYQVGASWSELVMAGNTSATPNVTLAAKVAATTDQELTFMYHGNWNGPWGTLRARLRNGTAGPGSGYWLELPTNSTTGSLMRNDGTTTSTLATFTVSTAQQPGYYLKFRVQGAVISFKRWQQGTAEPGSWTGQVSDPNPLTGPGGMQFDWTSNAGGQAVVVDYVVYQDLTNPPGAVLTNTYDNDDNLTSQATPSGTRTFTYTNGRLTGYGQSIGANTVESATLSYDSAGRITGDGTNTYTYDPAGQLLTSTLAGTTTSYGYDNRGRRTTAGTTTYVYDNAGQLVSSTTGGVTSTYTYDNAGRRTGQSGPGGARSYVYNSAGRLSSVTTPAGTFTRTYDAEGYLTASNGPTGTWHYDWDRVGNGVPMLSHWAGPGSQATFFGSDSVDIVRQGAGTYPTRQDPATNVRSTAGVTGAMPTDIATTTGYTPWGVATGATGTTPSLGYGAALSVGDGLAHLHNRTYDQTSGQFLTVDPADGTPGSPVLTHPYAYTENTPIVQDDPLGLFSVRIKVKVPGFVRDAVHFGKRGIDSAKDGVVGVYNTGARVAQRVIGVPVGLANLGVTGVKLIGSGVQLLGCARCVYDSFRVIPYYMYLQSQQYGSGPLAWLAYASHLANPLQGAVDSAAGLAGCLRTSPTSKCAGDLIFEVTNALLFLKLAGVKGTLPESLGQRRITGLWNKTKTRIGTSGHPERGSIQLPRKATSGGGGAGPVHGPIEPGRMPIDAQRQAGHLRGEPQYLNRLKSGKPTSAWDPTLDADAYTQYAWEHGTPTKNPNIRTFVFDHPVGSGGYGGTHSQVTVSRNPTTGNIHGYPSGPVSP